jgi:hypothetical protein
VSYLKVCDSFLDHPKAVRAVRLASSAAVHLWLGLLSYCKRNLTDGIVPLDMVPRVNGPATRYRARALDALVESGLVERVDDGLLMHDYLQWNPSKLEIERKSADRKAAAERRRLGADASEQRRSNVDAASSQRRSSGRGNVDAASGLRLAVSNDVAHIDAVETSTVLPRARKTETETETEIRSDPPVPPAGGSADELEKKSSKRRRSGGSSGLTQCPADFQPDATTQALAASLGFKPQLELDTRAYFIDWWRGAKRAKGDWQATYRNWLRKEAKTLGLKPPPPDTPQRRLWLEEKRKAEAVPVKVVPNARETIDAAMADMLAKKAPLHAAS